MNKANFVGVYCLLLVSSIDRVVTGQEIPVRLVAELRSTSRVDAMKRPPVCIRGVVSLIGEGLATTSRTPALTSFCIEDDSAGIWVNVAQSLDEKVWLHATDELLRLHEGLEIELEGLLDPGGFAPVILPSRIRILGEKPLPPAQVTSLDRLMRGAAVVQRVTVGGVVQSIAKDGKNRWLLKVETGLGHFLARLPKCDAFEPVRLLDAEVEFTGVAAASRNWRAEFICPRIIISRENDLVISKAPPSDPFTSEKVPLNSLDGYSTNGRPLHRRCVEGTVTYFEQGIKLYIQDGDSAVRVESTSDELLAIGDRVEASGFIDTTFSVAGLGGAVVRRIGGEKTPQPIPISLSEIEAGIERSKPVRCPSYDGMLVSMTGHLLDTHEVPSRKGLHRLELNCDDSVTTALVYGSIRDLLPGCQVQLTGIAEIHYAPAGTTANLAKPLRIDLLLRDNRDIVVLNTPSWWTARRTFTALLGAVAITIAVLVWAVALRRTVASQTRKLTKAMQGRRDAALEFKAALRERTRLAANLHDTVLQSMTGIAYQIEACESESLPVSQRGANHLATAKRMVQRGQEDLRSAVWALRALPLNERTFAESVSKVAKQISAGRNVAIKVDCVNDLPLLADFIAGNLLLILQEAIHNAIQHAKPKNIWITLSPLENGKRVSLAVQDDGSGFVLGLQRGANVGHFGLEGMRERAERLDGCLSIHSEPGKGTCISVEVPILEFDPELE